MMNRRRFLTGTLASGMLTSGGVAFGASAYGFNSPVSPAPLGFHNAPPEGIAEESLSLVSGRAPDGLMGTLYRNGPAHFRRGDQILDHWFDGDGFVRAFSINGNAATLQAQFVQTIKRERDDAAGRFIMPGFGTKAARGAPVASPDDANAANTSLLKVGDQLWALWEAGSPYALSPDDLSTIAPVTLRPDLAQMPFSAHPKVDKDGVIWNFGMAYGSPLTFIWALKPNGEVLKTGMVQLPLASYLHDWVVSDTKLIIPLQPWVFKGHRPPFSESLSWEPDLGLRILVVDKNDFSSRTLYELPAGAFFHTGGVVEETDGTLRFDICLADAPTLDSRFGKAVLHGVAIDRPQTLLQQVVLKPSGKSHLVSTGLPAEFPQADPQDASQRLFFVSEGQETTKAVYRYNAVAAFDWKHEQRDLFDFGPNVLVEEPVLVTARGSGLRHLLVTALHVDEGVTYLHAFNADNVSAGPVASWRSRLALPLGFHGVWLAS